MHLLSCPLRSLGTLPCLLSLQRSGQGSAEAQRCLRIVHRDLQAMLSKYSEAVLTSDLLPWLDDRPVKGNERRKKRLPQFVSAVEWAEPLTQYPVALCQTHGNTR
jgi:hypothetical protein